MNRKLPFICAINTVIFIYITLTLFSCAKRISPPDECGSNFAEEYKNFTTLRGLGTIFPRKSVDGINSSEFMQIDEKYLKEVCGEECIKTGLFDIPNCQYYKEKTISTRFLGIGGSKNDSLSVTVQSVTLKVVDLCGECLAKREIRELLNEKARAIIDLNGQFKDYTGEWAFVNRVWIADTFNIEIRRNRSSSISFLDETPNVDSVKSLASKFWGDIAKTFEIDLTSRDTLFLEYTVTTKKEPRYVRYDIFRWTLPEHQNLKSTHLHLEAGGTLGTVWDKNGPSVANWVPQIDGGIGCISNVMGIPKWGLMLDFEGAFYKNGWLINPECGPRLFIFPFAALDIRVGHSWGSIDKYERWARHGWKFNTAISTLVPKCSFLRIGIQTGLQQSHYVKSDGSKDDGYWFWNHALFFAFEIQPH